MDPQSAPSTGASAAPVSAFVDASRAADATPTTSVDVPYSNGSSVAGSPPSAHPSSASTSGVLGGIHVIGMTRGDSIPASPSRRGAASGSSSIPSAANGNFSPSAVVGDLPSVSNPSSSRRAVGSSSSNRLAHKDSFGGHAHGVSGFYSSAAGAAATATSPRSKGQPSLPGSMPRFSRPDDDEDDEVDEEAEELDETLPSGADAGETSSATMGRGAAEAALAAATATATEASRSAVASGSSINTSGSNKPIVNARSSSNLSRRPATATGAGASQDASSSSPSSPNPSQPVTTPRESSRLMSSVTADPSSSAVPTTEVTPVSTPSRKEAHSSRPSTSSGMLNVKPSTSTRAGSSSHLAPPSSNGATPAATTTSSASRPPRTTSSRIQPALPCAPGLSPAPPPAMYWSKAPVHGSVPRRTFRAHTASLAEEVLWLFGGCDNKGCFRELWCFDTETMCWSKPKVTGDLPPPRRAHTATMVDRRLFVFAGGDGPHYFNDLYVFDTVALRWSKPDVYGSPPSPRRAHTANYYQGQLIIFGGGNGVGALNDVYTLDIQDLDRLEWKKVECKGKLPIGRGYHTCNLVDGKLIVIGGSDGHLSFNDIHILRLDTKIWSAIKTDEIHSRLAHTATQVGSYLFVIGGHDSQSYTPEILTLNLVNLQWEPRRVCGQKPPGRGYHQAWLRDSRLFIHGGFNGKEIYDDLYFVDLAACAYLPQITSFTVELDDE